MVQTVFGELFSSKVLKYDNEILNRLDSLPACLINYRKMTGMWILCFLELNIDMIEMQTYV